MTTAIPKTTASALAVSCRAMLAPFAPACVIDRAVGAMLAALENEQPAAADKGQDRLLPAKEVGRLLNRSTKTVRALAARGLIRAVRLGAAGARAGGYLESSVFNFLAGRCESGEVRNV